MDDIVSYIYDEIGEADRTKFETHLRGCHECTNEFAGISNARFSVYEWRREEFTDLPTPEIVIPYVTKTTVEEETSVGLWAGLRGWLTLVKFPAAVAAGLVLCLGLGFLVLRYLNRVEQPIAANVKNISPIETREVPIALPTVNDKKPDVALTTEPSVKPSREIRSVKVMEQRRAKNEKHLTASNPAKRNAIPNISNAPVLSENIEEADDNSLRLSDLFADVDG